MGKLPSTHGEEAQSSTSPSLRSPAFPRALQQRDSLMSRRVPAGRLPAARAPQRGVTWHQPGAPSAPHRTSWPGPSTAATAPIRLFGLSSAPGRFQQAAEAAAHSLPMAAPAARPGPAHPTYLLSPSGGGDSSAAQPRGPEALGRAALSMGSTSTAPSARPQHPDPP